MTEKQKIIVFDCETTGLDCCYDEILSLSIIDGDGNVLFDRFIKPKRRKKWPEAEAVNGISPKMVENQKTISHYIKDIQNIFDNANVLVAYNADFDLSFLAAAGLKLNNDVNIYDVMLEFAPIYGDWNDYFMDYKWQKLSTCAYYYGYKWDGSAHESLADVKATLHCYKAMTNNQ